MLNLLKRLIYKGDTESLKPVEFEFTCEIRFTLKIKNLIIGYLSVENELWNFRYSDEFKKQSKYARLTGFSDLEKIYKTDVLWPFFKIRIPGLKQPMIMDIIESENLDAKNEAVLLKRFGKKTMSNPYILDSV